MIIKACKYQLRKSGNWKPGITIESDGDSDGMIIGDKGDIIPSPVYDVKDLNFDLLIDVGGILKNIQL